MGGVSSMCEAWFDDSVTLRKSSLNPKYVSEKRNSVLLSKENPKRSTAESPLKTEASSSATKSKGQSLSMDDFSIVKVLGRGSYGKIFLVQKKTNKKYYALKVIKKQDLNKPGLRQNILTEKDVLMQARHPFVVRLKYSFQNASRIYMVMDFCQGGELFLKLKRTGKFSDDAVRFYAAEVILALQYLHEKLGIIHRDLKPENILLCADGHIKVTDFGLSKVSNRTYSICGTPEYIAPEVILRQGYGKLVDWWSVGCLMFEMLTGSPPFSSDDRDELSDDILLKNAKFPKDMSEAAQDIITKLLDKDPNHRLGVRGIDEIKQHEFFKGLDWDAVLKKKATPPFVPEVKGIEDVSNFYKAYTNEPASETPLLKPTKAAVEEPDFPSFSYLDDTMSEMHSMSHVDRDILGSVVDERKLSLKQE